MEDLLTSCNLRVTASSLTMASASSLLNIHLDPEEKLLMSGDDLSNFFYTFQVGYDRGTRNFLDWRIPIDLVKDFPGFPEHLKNETHVFACLSTLAMGDSGACSYAQTSHIALGLQAGAFDELSLLCMHGRCPRSPFLAGVVIDDLVMLEKVARSASTGKVTAGRRTAMHAMYERVGLEAHPTKGFADEGVYSFWGATVDGEVGLVQANVARAASLAWVASQVATMGVCSVGLLEVLAGGFVALFMFRRRMMSLLDLIYVCQAGRDRREVVQLPEAAIDELWGLAILCPLAVTDLRARFADSVYMVDASNWGEAVVASSLGRGWQSEIHRHALSRSCWTKLLSPFKALQRAKGCLPVHEELPDGGRRLH